MWYSGGGTRSSLHYDQTETIICEYRGNKTYFMFDKHKHKVGVKLVYNYYKCNVGRSRHIQILLYFIDIWCCKLSVKVKMYIFVYLKSFDNTTHILLDIKVFLRRHTTIKTVKKRKGLMQFICDTFSLEFHFFTDQLY